MIDAWKIFADIGLQYIRMATGEMNEPLKRPVGSKPLPVGV